MMKQTKKRGFVTNNSLARFDVLPDCARVPGAVVDTLCGVSRWTRIRRVKAGILPAPGVDGSFAVGEIRAALAKLSGAQREAP